MKNIDKMNVKFLSIVSYIGPLFIIGKFSVEKDLKEVEFHNRQGIILFCIVTVLYFFCFLISVFSNYLFDFLEIIMFLVLVGTSVGWFILMLIGILNAARNRMSFLPIVGRLNMRKGGENIE